MMSAKKGNGNNSRHLQKFHAFIAIINTSAHIYTHISTEIRSRQYPGVLDVDLYLKHLKANNSTHISKYKCIYAHI